MALEEGTCFHRSGNAWPTQTPLRPISALSQLCRQLAEAHAENEQVREEPPQPCGQGGRGRSCKQMGEGSKGQGGGVGGWGEGVLSQVAGILS